MGTDLKSVPIIPGYFAFANPVANMPAYGMEVGRAVGCGALMLMQDYKPEEKERLLINYAQVGIDYWGVVKKGGTAPDFLRPISLLPVVNMSERFPLTVMTISLILAMLCYQISDHRL